MKMKHFPLLLPAMALLLPCVRSKRKSRAYLLRNFSTLLPYSVKRIRSLAIRHSRPLTICSHSTKRNSLLILARIRSIWVTIWNRPPIPWFLQSANILSLEVSKIRISRRLSTTARSQVIMQLSPRKAVYPAIFRHLLRVNRIFWNWWHSVCFVHRLLRISTALSRLRLSARIRNLPQQAEPSLNQVGKP